MDVALLIARLVLAAVFAVAGAAKLADLRGSRSALTGFGLPAPLARPVGVLLPLAELATAGLLLPATTGAWGAAAALVLLFLFVAGIGANLARGRRPDCHCFGALHSEPAGPRTLARNGILAVVAAFAAIEGRNGAGASATAWIGRLDAAAAALLVASLGLAAVLALGALAFVRLLRQHGRILLRLDRVEEALGAAGLYEEADEMPEIGHPPGTPAPYFSMPDLEGARVTLSRLLASELPLLLVFTSPTCGPCQALMPTVAGWQRDHAEVLTVVVASTAAPGAVRAEAESHGLARVLVDEEYKLYNDYKANGTPSAVLVGANGTIASWMASGSDWIERLLRDSLPAPELGIPVGQPVPPLVLRDLEDAEVPLADVWEGETVLLFWRSTCGFCRQMHEELLEWEASRRPGHPSLVVVSGDEPDELRKERFRSRVLRDPEQTASGAFEAGGTPMAVRIDVEGRVSSSLATGAAAVFEVLRASVTM